VCGISTKEREYKNKMEWKSTSRWKYKKIKLLLKERRF